MLLADGAGSMETLQTHFRRRIFLEPKYIQDLEIRLLTMFPSCRSKHWFCSLANSPFSFQPPRTKTCNPVSFPTFEKLERRTNEQ